MLKHKLSQNEGQGSLTGKVQTFAHLFALFASDDIRS